MNFSEIRAEFFDRGTSYLAESSDGIARAERWLNQGYRKILNHTDWPFLETTVTGTAPVTVADVRRIRWVRKSGESGFPLKFATSEELVTEDGVLLTDTGSPEFYYFDTAGRIATWPTNSDVLEVVYIKRVAPMVMQNAQNQPDTPLFDEEYHNLIVDMAMVKAYEDSDNFAAARTLRASIKEDLDSMTEDYQVSQMGPRYVRYVHDVSTDG